MKLTFHGAARCTTGSMHLVETDRQRILLDCGLQQGHRAEAFQRNAHLPFDPKTLSTAILSHAHIDHSGNLPTLVKHGFAGEVNCTTATRDLATLMLRDSAHIQEQDAAYLNQKKSRQGLPLASHRRQEGLAANTRGEGDDLRPIKPLYTTLDAEDALTHLVGHAYHRWFRLNGGGRAMLLDAGHILGSAMIILELDAGGRTVRLGFTGDLGRPGALILRDRESAPALDYLIIESTYGNREHGMREQSEEALASIVRATVARGGKVIIPAFAVERTQEIIYSLHRQTEAGQIPAVPIFVDSPLAIDATDVFRVHLECLREEARQHLLAHPDPFGFGRLRFARTVDESKQINAIQGSAIIISANGMCEAGRVLHHLKNNIEDERNTIVFVGYQAEHTLGRRLVDGARKAKIFGDEFDVRAQIAKVDGFSAHADHSELLDWVASAKENLKGIFVVHGEEPAALALAEDLRTLGDFTVTVPQLDQTIEL